eukprot:12937166-Prorocentrum_lima.AAC.1
MKVARRFMDVRRIGPSTTYIGEQPAQGRMASKLVSNPLCKEQSRQRGSGVTPHQPIHLSPIARWRCLAEPS